MQVSQVSMSPGMSSMTLTVKRGSSVCYSIKRWDGFYASGMTTAVVKNASGTPIATLAESPPPASSTVTCPGGAPTAVDATCGSTFGQHRQWYAHRRELHHRYLHLLVRTNQRQHKSQSCLGGTGSGRSVTCRMAGARV